jgi:hypothetical protein
MMESVEERLKRIIECVKCPETGSEHFGEWGILTREQRLFLNNLARDTIDLLDCMDKKIRETQYQIEQGTLIELPCKVGDTVYVIYQYDDFMGTTEEPFIEKDTVSFFVYDDNKMKIVPSNYAERSDYWYTTIDILLTREEAEKRLKELQE